MDSAFFQIPAWDLSVPVLFLREKISDGEQYEDLDRRLRKLEAA